MTSEYLIYIYMASNMQCNYEEENKTTSQAFSSLTFS